VHDMRNILAVVRESTGLAQDIAGLVGTSRESGNASLGKERLRESLAEVQHAVRQAAALSEAMDYMAQAGGADTRNPAGPCDLVRVCRSFQLLAARQARSVQMPLKSGDTREPVWLNVPALVVLDALLELVDLCAAVGGQVTLCFTARRLQKKEGILVEVLDGPNREMVIAALTGVHMLSSTPSAWRAGLRPWHDSGSRYFLSIAESEVDSQ
jgi:hypothetical protein